VGDYAKVFDPRPYTSGRSSLAEMDTSLSEMAARVMELLPVDERSDFRAKISSYKTYADLPADLRSMIDQWAQG
jgi:hypothetical protein